MHFKQNIKVKNTSCICWKLVDDGKVNKVIFIIFNLLAVWLNKTNITLVAIIIWNLLWILLILNINLNISNKWNFLI